MLNQVSESDGTGLRLVEYTTHRADASRNFYNINIMTDGRVAELVDARGLGPRGATHGGSSPLSPTILKRVF